ncbi:MAG: hypothetical protein R2824_02815 [Saprospiraceae bacterium]|nr:hypothetical protein [Lewinella sp.]
MRKPLKKFTDFTNALLPNETAYLLSVQQFEEEDRLKILRQIDFNAQHIEQFTPYDTSIDKRKYNHLQNWIETRLKAIDVDEQFNKMLDWEQKILTDSIQAAEEKQLLKAIRKYRHPSYFFTKFYELIEHYRHFLLIRLRYADHQLADKFLKKYRKAYLQAREVKEKLHEASLAVVGQYAGRGGESRQWEGWLSDVFYNEELEGQIRYLALVRLVFVCHNYRKYDLVREKFDYLDQKLSEGLYYSKRLLVNYYSNRLMMHSHYREYDRAVYYGYLSVRARTHDYLFYVNNLCAVLLRLGRNQEALQLMQEASSEAKKTKNFHNRIGFVAFYMQALKKNGMLKNAGQYGDTFLKAYAKEILQYRWHLFFSVYLEVMFSQHHFEKLLKTARKYRLRERDKNYRSNANYLPVIPLYVEAAQFREGNISQSKFFDITTSCLADYDLQSNRTFRTFWENFTEQVPEVRDISVGGVAGQI